MAIQQIGRVVGLVALLMLASSGCTLYQPRPVTITVRDGDTGAPIKGAEVRTSHLAMLDFGVLFAAIGPTDGRTDSDGKLSLVTDARKSNFHMSVEAIGWGRYQGGPQVLRSPWYAWHDEIDIELFCGSKPVAEVTFPDGYRGPVAVRVAERGRDLRSNGERRFQYRASTHGAVEIRERTLFEIHGSYDCVEANFANGTKIPTVVANGISNLPTGNVADDEIALRFVTTEWEHRTWFYFIGTLAAAQAFERKVWPDDRHFNEAEFKKIVDSTK